MSYASASKRSGLNERGVDRSPLRVLVVEDVDTMRHYLGHLVGSIPGVSVSGLAQNGAEALLEVSRHRPDGVILDEVLPGESSVDLANAWIADGLRVALVSGASDLGPVPRPLPWGVTARLLKQNLDPPARGADELLQLFKKWGL